MIVDTDEIAVVGVRSAHTNTKAEKPSLTVSTTGLYQDMNSDSGKVITNVSSMISPSTDTTSSTITTKIEDETNEMEILLKELDKASDIRGFKNKDDEEFSVASSTSSAISRYFEPTDFIPWEELYSKAEYAPHVGFAIAAGSFAFLHPIVFFAGVVTAVGAARAAGATYEYVNCMQQNKKGREGDATSDDLIFPCDCFTALGFSNNLRDENLKPTLPPADKKVGEADSVPSMGKSCSTCSTNASTVGDLQDDSNGKAKSVSLPRSTVPSIIESPRRLKSPKETPESTRWVKEKFPVLPIIALKNVEFRGLNSHEFFDVFFADDAPFGFPAFHILRRDKEVEYSSWNTGFKSGESTSNIDMSPSITTKERAVQYHAKTNSFLGPAYAPTRKLQRAYFLSKKMLVIDIKMTLHDIPFSKQFYLIERWVIDGTRSGSHAVGRTNSRNGKRKQNYVNSPRASPSHCVYLTVSSEVFFTQECAFESAVRKESTKQVCEISKCWNAMAQAGLKRTEETRNKRLRQREEQTKKESSPDSKIDQDECIEIEHIDDNAANGRRGANRRRSSIRGRRRSSSKLQNQNRRLSQSFSKLLTRDSSSIKTGEDSQELPKVRIFSQGRL